MAEVAIVGAGWAGLTAAVHAVQAGHRVTLLEAAPQVGGRARSVGVALPDGTRVTLDNGQHILIGAYQHTLAAMRTVGLQPDALLLRLPLDLRTPEGRGLRLPQGRSPWNAALGIFCAQGWPVAAKASLLRAALVWQWLGFECPAGQSVAQLCAGVHPLVLQELIEPLCVAALNTPSASASAQTFLCVLRDSLFGPRGSSDLLLPRRAMSDLFPNATLQWLRERGTVVQLGHRVQHLSHADGAWILSRKDAPQVQAERVVLALDATSALRLLTSSAAQVGEHLAERVDRWCAVTQALRFEAITTVYAYAPQARLVRPMVALHNAANAPAQFAFDRGQLDGHAGVIALVASASQGERETLQSQCLEQARAQLQLQLAPLQTITEHRATFACHAGVVRPGHDIAPGLCAVGDYVDGPYPATLEGAVRSAARVCDTPAAAAGSFEGKEDAS